MLANYDEEEPQKQCEKEQETSSTLNETDIELEKKRADAAIKIQTQIRSFLARKKASVVAQAKKRLFEQELEQERREYEKAKEERKKLKLETAALNIQALWRAFSIRRDTSQLKKQHDAAVKIQCMVRQRLSRVRAERAKKQKQAELEKFLEEERKMYADLLNSL
ncbi:hypothetical protein FDP41_002786 [Naegleria fowleri]|uniref:Uncharacterized protein n=1 Tax=Naegleria fowleri TaxID=5763 RepID=A0A6A5BV20_NAEFO|nr:uncharacterized protein FDP41_002786 [Naegleria fowleri]KAF0978271.1 hypothetical protein FDP41_002786 [Naegleria fowleri]